MIARVDPASLPKFPDFSIEQTLWKIGLTRLGGIDEAGRGAWAGPVSAGVVILPPKLSVLKTLHGVRDSKQMTVQQRESWVPLIQQTCLAWGVGFASAGEIDAIGILPATRLAALRALQNLSLTPEHLITDYLNLPEISIPQTPLIKGDRRSLSVAAASVLAKTSRDALMRQLENDFPAYGFACHKGYGTRRHQEAIRTHGLCIIHRKSFDIQK
ncbi:MAG: ribonuclease HII [Chloroflexi bacterium GWB2_49_20]|nr:MAG: ribonuclease HII [Chloroflexi bacterium GWB2_49_20]OGN77150.1 MAG: ribonuclease HII [Chloroflexi bacterium GWC2_49_37]OGN83876.1 MAG: ribonuclease HII [Chloroflexi bacterium GWD2_49_16]